MRSLISQTFSSTCLGRLSGFFRHFWPKNNPHCHNRIVFDLSSAVGYQMEVRLSPWQSDAPFSWVSKAEGAQLATGAFLEPPGISWEVLIETHGETLTKGMPGTLIQVINAVPFLGVEIAQVAGRLEAALDMVVSSPLLLILLVEKGAQERWSADTFAALLCHKQSTLCAAAGLPATRSCAKLLRRCQLGPMIRRELLALKRGLNNPGNSEFVRHQPCVHARHLIFLANYEGARWPGLLTLIDEALTQAPHYRGSAWLKAMLVDTQRMLATGSEALYPVVSLATFQALHDRLVDVFNGHATAGNLQSSATELEQRHGPYPTPSLPNTTLITAITSWQDLLLEGERMRHCVGSYSSAVANGQVAIYHLQQPEPVTVAITPQGQRWVLSQASGVRNAPLSKEAEHFIHVWLTKQS
ncbi:PcfJ domain-containing protein [Vreelandella neptunia]|uniref:PcfJ domain-containing protein n=1 Tax=Vreelandella neptunia TaxID=115551 RepID=A0ABZ0YKC0_9GAMM|nr:PcfJ domain-containing protein [Halomonas neptunia]MDN3562089.1 PcfJ domain-containing protein [Halomonas neptunia]WQH11792.1 PcfJ domain-containing protein [Halomonas neptunia]